MLPTCPPLGQPSLQVLRWDTGHSFCLGRTGCPKQPQPLGLLLGHLVLSSSPYPRSWWEKMEEGGILSQSCSRWTMQLERLEYCLLWSYRHSFLMAPGQVSHWNCGGDRNTSSSLQPVAGSDSAGREPLSFPHCSLPECPGAPWLVLLKARACRVPFSGLLLSVGFCLQTLWRSGGGWALRRSAFVVSPSPAPLTH